MRQKQMRARVRLFAAAMLLAGASDGAWAQQGCYPRGGFAGRRGILGAVCSGYTGPYSSANPGSNPWATGNQPQRFYDSTGRWVGDGYDHMSTAPQLRVINTGNCPPR